MPTARESHVCGIHVCGPFRHYNCSKLNLTLRSIVVQKQLLVCPEKKPSTDSDFWVATTGFCSSQQLRIALSLVMKNIVSKYASQICKVEFKKSFDFWRQNTECDLEESPSAFGVSWEKIGDFSTKIKKKNKTAIFLQWSSLLWHAFKSPSPYFQSAFRL